MKASDVGLTPEEFERIVTLMGREPNAVELGLFGAMWSEHCSYKSSKALLSWLPHDGPFVVQGPGENAGVVRLNDAYEVAFKIESHNHPSYVEPVQGAATGVGGILRDIFAMGARPVALADSLRFGLGAEAEHLARGIVEGVGAYGNAIGVPTVTGEAYYGAPYQKNPLVNVLAVGTRAPGTATSAASARAGSLLVLIGQATGRDGIHGASLLASFDFADGQVDMRPTVQVGDPFLGKLLMETTLSAVDQGLTEAVQDLGAAGLTSSVSELCFHSGVGVQLWLDRVPCRETGMTSYDIMLSETQERMLMAVREEHLPAMQALVDHFGVTMAVIGQLTEGPDLVLLDGETRVAEVSPRDLVDRAPRRLLAEGWRESVSASGEDRTDDHWEIAFRSELLLEVLGAPDVRSRRRIYEQYDSMIQTHTTRGPGHDCAVLRLRGSDEGLAMAVAGPARYAAEDAYAGGVAAVLRALSSLATQAALPLGMTDGINAGNPDRESPYFQLSALIAGIADAASAAGVPVTGGNVSLHNETDGRPIWATGIIGAVGRHPRPLEPFRDDLVREGLKLYLINPTDVSWQHLGGSVLRTLLRDTPGPFPRVSLEPAVRAMAFVRDLLSEGMVESSKLVSDGGLAVALVQMMLRGDQSLGLSLSWPDGSVVPRLFNEMPGQFVVTVDRDGEERLVEEAVLKGIEVLSLGQVSREATLSWGRHRWSRDELSRAFEGGAS